MRGQRFAIRVELFPTRSLPNRSKHVFSAAGAAADRPAAPPATPAAQKSQSRPPELPRPRQTDGRASKTLNLQTSFFETLPKSREKLGCQTSLALVLPQPVWPQHTGSGLARCGHTGFCCGRNKGKNRFVSFLGRRLCPWLTQTLKPVPQEVQDPDEVGC